MIRSLLILSLCISFAAAQQLVVKADGAVRTVPAGTTEVTASAVASAPSLVNAPTENVRVIVEWKTPSRLEQRISGRLFSKSVAERAQRNVLQVADGAVVGRTFEEAFSGIALTVQRSSLPAIAALSDVKAVHPDATVTASPADAVPSTPVLPQSAASATGRGVRIGIIDTGVDYLHEAFGKGMGPGKVIAGGYDVVNNDADPMDDNGHGTHVAGIICGSSSTITGAAKDASVYVYKALDANGSGSTSAVLAAIERAIADSVRVLNMSLGTPAGSADDPLASAVNRAAAAGIVVVVAAGNTGEYSGINSPGIAANALTVGAADGNAIASFSSKGPETQSYTVKPDVVAPGVNILSAKMGGGYVQMSGTSMAAPAVTALAAAMRELHPDWSAAEIRNALISNSASIGTPLFTQGHGRLDARALSATAFSSPAQLSFGFDPPGAVSWTQQRTVTLSNRSSAPRSYALSSASVNAAIGFRFTPQQVTVPAQGTVAVTVELQTNNLYLANNSAFESGYTGTILAAGADTIVLPYAFIKAPVLQLTFSEVPWMVLVHNRKTFTKTLSPKTNALSLIVKDDSYDVVTSFYGSRYVVNENVTVNGKAAVDIAASQAVYPVSFQPVNEKGEKLDLATLKGTNSYLEAFVHQPTGFAIVGMGGGKTTSYSNRTKYFSAVSRNYAYGYSMTLQPTNTASYTYDVIVDTGITAPRTIAFQSSELKRVDVKYDVLPSVLRAFPITWTTFVGRYATLSVTFYDGNSEPMRAPFAQASYYTQRKVNFPIFHQREAYSY